MWLIPPLGVYCFTLVRAFVRASDQLQRKPLGLFHWNLMWGYLWAIHLDIFFIFAIRPIFWPPGGHLENQAGGRLSTILCPLCNSLALQDFLMKFAWVMYRVTKVCHKVESLRSNCAFCHQGAKTQNTKTGITTTEIACVPLRDKPTDIHLLPEESQMLCTS
jgi:hypothetical protein